RKIRHRTRLLTGVALAGGVLAATPILAQEAAPAASQSQSQSQSQSGAVAVDDIVVTAQRREQSINTVGMGIQAFGGETLDQLHVTDVKDLS
ncbi:hypothetical protein NL465_28920, partial [Klebsiella pneumoniae]|nr:hypothetical protein [Klebsiella pneumoniae]